MGKIEQLFKETFKNELILEQWKHQTVKDIDEGKRTRRNNKR